jgi:hypothetical protein
MQTCTPLLLPFLNAMKQLLTLLLVHHHHTIISSELLKYVDSAVVVGGWSVRIFAEELRGSGRGAREGYPLFCPAGQKQKTRLSALFSKPIKKPPLHQSNSALFQLPNNLSVPYCINQSSSYNAQVKTSSERCVVVYFV